LPYRETSKFIFSGRYGHATLNAANVRPFEPQLIPCNRTCII
jgi:hypothetical protein